MLCPLTRAGDSSDHEGTVQKLVTIFVNPGPSPPAPSAASRAVQSRDDTVTLWVYVTDAPAMKVQGVQIRLNNPQVALDRGSNTDWLSVGSEPNLFELIATPLN